MRISEAESRIMQVLWDRGPTRADDLIGEVAAAHGWGDGTVRTLINRLRRKKAIESRKDAGRAVYHPRLARDAYVLAESRTFLDRLFHGEVAPLIVHFADHRALTPKDIEALKALIARIEDE